MTSYTISSNFTNREKFPSKLFYFRLSINSSLFARSFFLSFFLTIFFFSYFFWTANAYPESVIVIPAILLLPREFPGHSTPVSRMYHIQEGMRLVIVQQEVFLAFFLGFFVRFFNIARGTAKCRPADDRIRSWRSKNLWLWNVQWIFYALERIYRLTGTTFSFFFFLIFSFSFCFFIFFFFFT